MSCNRITTFRNAADTMLASRIMAARCQAKVIRKAVRILEAFDVTDPRKQSDGSHRTNAGECFETYNVCHPYFRTFDEFGFDFENLLVMQFPRLNVHIDFDPIYHRQWNMINPFLELFRGIIFRRCILCHVMLVDNAFDLVDGLRALLDQILPEISELANLGIGRIGRKNPANAIGTLTALEPLAVIPKQFAEGVCVSFISFVHGRVVWLDNNDFGTSCLLEFFKQPVVETADFNDCHVATMLSCLFSEGNEKVVNIGMSGTDLTLLDHFSVFVSDIDGQMVLVLVDTEIQHAGYSLGLKVNLQNILYLTGTHRAIFTLQPKITF